MSQKQVLQNKPGLTIIELLISMAVFAVVGVVLSNILIAQNRSFKEQWVRNKLISDSFLIFSQVRRYSLYANSVLPSYTYNAVEYTTDQDTVVLQLPALNASDEVISNEYDIIIFDYTAPALHVIVDPNNLSKRTALDSELLNNITDIVFRYDAEDMTNVTRFSFTLEMEEEYLENKIQQGTYTSTFSIRNIIST